MSAAVRDGDVLSGTEAEPSDAPTASDPPLAPEAETSRALRPALIPAAATLAGAAAGAGWYRAWLSDDPWTAGGAGTYTSRGVPVMALAIGAVLAVAIGWAINVVIERFIEGRRRADRADGRGRDPRRTWAGGFFLVAAIYAAWGQSSFDRNDPTPLVRYMADRTSPDMGRFWGGVVTSMPTRMREREASWGPPVRTRFTMDLRHVRSGQTRGMTGTAEVWVGGDRSDVRLGDFVEVGGVWRIPRGRTNPGGRDPAAGLRVRGVHGRIDVTYPRRVRVLERSAGLRARVGGWLNAAADRTAAALRRHLGQRRASIASGFVLGRRDGVDEDLRDDMLATGTVHLLSVSGLHLGIVAVLAGWTASAMAFARQRRIAWVVTVCLVYMVLTGGRPPVVRAAVLLTAVMAGHAVRRRVDPINTLALAAIVLTFWNPASVTMIGVHLSFAAVAALSLIGVDSLASRNALSPSGTDAPDASADTGDPPPAASDRVVPSDPRVSLDARADAAERLTRLVEDTMPPWRRALADGRRWLRAAVWASFVVTAATTPLIWWRFNVVTPIAVPVNVAAAPLLFAAVAGSFATAAADLAWRPAGRLPGYVTSGAIDSLRWLVGVARDVPGGHFFAPSPPGWWVAVFYAACVAWYLTPAHRRTAWFSGGVIAFFGSRRGRPALAVVGLAAWAVVAWTLIPRDPPPPGVEATFVDVGHGTGVVLRWGGDIDPTTGEERPPQTWLYDGGRMGNRRGDACEIDTTLWSMGVRRLDGLCLSHADADHFNALPRLLSRFAVDRIVTPPGLLQTDEPAVRDLARVIDDHGTPVQTVVAGDVIAGRMRVLHPTAAWAGRDDVEDNAASMVLSIAAGGRELLLPGDLEPPGTGVLVDTPRPAPGGVLMAPHHGSLRMDADVVLAWSRPSQVVVSGGRRTADPEVAEMLSAVGSDVHLTRLHGAIRVRIDEEGRARIDRFRPGGGFPD